MQQTLHQRGHYIFVFRQHIDALRGRARPVNHQWHVQVRASPVHVIRFITQRYAVARGNNDYRIVQFAGFAQCRNDPCNLSVDIASCAGVAANKAFLIAVIKRGAVECYP
ncbi:hypothetical protein D3C85_1599180 [compost metagenome]